LQASAHLVRHAESVIVVTLPVRCGAVDSVPKRNVDPAQE